MYAFLHGVPGRLYRGLWLEPRRNLYCLFGVTTGQWGNITARWCPGGSAWTAAAGANRWRSPGAWPACQRVCSCPLAGDPTLRRCHDAGGELPRARRLRSLAVATLRTQPGNGRGDRAVGQRLRARIFVAAVTGANRGAWLARRLSDAGRTNGGGRSAARCSISGHGTGTCGRRPGRAGELDAPARDAHASFLVIVFGLCVYRVGQLPGGTAPTRLCGHGGL